MTAPVAEPLGAAALAWLLRRLHQGTSLAGHDLVLVNDHELFADAGTSLYVGDQVWRVGRAGGELTLRDLLPEADRLVALIPRWPVPPPDVGSRAYLGRPLELDPRDVVAGITGRFCQPLDEELGAAVLQGADLLREHVGFWTSARW